MRTVLETFIPGVIIYYMNIDSGTQQSCGNKKMALCLIVLYVDMCAYVCMLKCVFVCLCVQ